MVPGLLVHIWVEPRVLVGVGDVDGITGGGNAACDARGDGNTDVDLPLHGPQLTGLGVRQEQRAAVCVHQRVGALRDGEHQ